MRVNSHCCCEMPALDQAKIVVCGAIVKRDCTPAPETAINRLVAAISEAGRGPDQPGHRPGPVCGGHAITVVTAGASSTGTVARSFDDAGVVPW
jgi:hypothetical protein